MPSYKLVNSHVLFVIRKRAIPGHGVGGTRDEQGPMTSGVFGHPRAIGELSRVDVENKYHVSLTIFFPDLIRILASAISMLPLRKVSYAEDRTRVGGQTGTIQYARLLLIVRRWITRCSISRD